MTNSKVRGGFAARILSALTLRRFANPHFDRRSGKKLGWQIKKVVSGRPASAWGKATARLGPPDITFFISDLS
jgi:hypothetical protein